MNDNLQEHILNLWIQETETLRIIKKTKLAPEQFKNIFAAKIFQYLLNVYHKKTELGDCPVVFAMLSIFKKSKLTIAEVHHVCDTFKINLTHTLYEHNEIDLVEKLLVILRENFKGVLKSYMEINYNIDIGQLNIINDKNQYLTSQPCTLQAQKIDLIEPLCNEDEESDYVKDYVNTEETQEESFIIQNALSGDLLDDFNDANETFFNLAIMEKTYTQKYHELLSSSINIYISIFLDLLFFNKIANSLNDLKSVIADTSMYSDEQLLVMKELTESLMNNLIKWKEEVIDNKIQAIHYYDDAIIGDIEQLKVMLSAQEHESAEDTAEALDDIFDF